MVTVDISNKIIAIHSVVIALISLLYMNRGKVYDVDRLFLGSVATLSMSVISYMIYFNIDVKADALRVTADDIMTSPIKKRSSIKRKSLIHVVQSANFVDLSIWENPKFLLKSRWDKRKMNTSSRFSCLDKMKRNDISMMTRNSWHGETYRLIEAKLETELLYDFYKHRHDLSFGDVGTKGCSNCDVSHYRNNHRLESDFLNSPQLSINTDIFDTNDGYCEYSSTDIDDQLIDMSVNINISKEQDTQHISEKAETELAKTTKKDTSKDTKKNHKNRIVSLIYDKIERQYSSRNDNTILRSFKIGQQN